MSPKDDKQAWETHTLERGIEEALRDPGAGAEAQRAEQERPRRSRTETMDDPLTAALLAEVARTSRTLDFEDDSDDEATARLLADAARTATVEIDPTAIEDAIEASRTEPAVQQAHYRRRGR